MARRDNALAVAGPLTKSIIFAIIGFLILAVLWIQFGQIRFNSQKTYSAIFTSASQILPASAVTAAGVNVGRVDDVEIVDNDKAKVTFTIDASVGLTDGTEATIKYKNLTGDQYLDLTPGAGSTTPLADGATIPDSRTKPALDLDVLLGGFNPLFQGLQPDQINQLSNELVNVLQGEGGTINSVFEHAASFTGSLAQQDQVIGSVITNLNTVLGSLDKHQADLSATVEKAQTLVSQLSTDRQQLVTGLQKTSDLAQGIGDIANALRSGHDTYTELGRAAKVFTDQTPEFDRILRLLPGAYLRMGRASVGGAAYNLNVCAVTLRLTGPDGKPYFTPQIGPSDNSLRCSRDDVAPLEGSDGTPTQYGGPPNPWDGQAVARPGNGG
ncbi:MCE family protein [Pseudonocardia acidicola]|uniref:MCE family protein n=1 Tax=Pseudonocardia acidicola TaxID=2724939 RepID=A0ABX1S9M3_9PSEU|nr:MlaD family protein [Pseudonocardia acidicola]NMH98275.1 MCE family protein [Pseudonocardia acidicola]